MENKKEKDASNVEFGIEFGDFNAAKHLETPYMNKDKKKKESKKEDC
ncbi:hypothetical protein ACFYKX_23825 [Cytobacillus sp. FJAT-54145]|uniref:Uncharacterized protein n=1 Tax=Cytobacillus spartinae TaxID=3299023 RepID=A0ABW6KIP6_9BACI